MTKLQKKEERLLREFCLSAAAATFKALEREERAAQRKSKDVWNYQPGASHKLTKNDQMQRLCTETAQLDSDGNPCWFPIAAFDIGKKVSFFTRSGFRIRAKRRKT